MENKSFSLQRLRFERLSRYVTQGDVAEALGLSTNAYGRKENGDINITVEELPVIFEAIGIPINEVNRFYKEFYRDSAHENN